MDISTSTPVGPPTTSISLGTINARVVSEGSFNEGRGQWLVNARAWYPNAVIELATDTAQEILTDYFDVLAKVQHDVGAHSTLSASVLLAYDDLGFTEEDEESKETASALYRSHQEWINLRTDWTDVLSSQTVLSSGRIDRNRSGTQMDSEEGNFYVDDHRLVDFLGAKQDWTWAFDDSHYLKWGVDVRREKADYGYSSVSVVFDAGNDEPSAPTEVVVDVEPSGTSFGAYLADRFRLAEPLVVEFGLRWTF